MVFSSTLFLFLFFPITLSVYYLIKPCFRNIFLLIASLIFFAWSQPQYLWIILLSVLINYGGGIHIGLTRNLLLKRILLIVIIALNLGLLIYFKYFNFICNTISQFGKTDIVMDEIVLPIGISFFTFQGLSYSMDVYKGKTAIQKNPFKLALYISLFPQLIAGPIVRYTDVADEIDHRTFNIDDFTSGICKFTVGLSKKAVISNTVAVIVDDIWSRGLGRTSPSLAWLASIAYSLQIYFDFSGYSDMAIGLGKMFGFHFCENFNLPYISKSISEFWRRWHISLSSWFRDYVYIPLGGNRKHVYLNLAIVFLLTGIWHGAAWQFIVWGIYHGIFILFERLVRNKKLKTGQNTELSHKKGIVLAIGKNLLTLFIVNVGWVLFRAENLAQGFGFILIMFGFNQGTPIFTPMWYLTGWNLFIIVLAIIASSIIPEKTNDFIKTHLDNRIYVPLTYLFTICLLLLSLIRVVAGSYNPFIYFQF